jgi:hypothetical protein
MSLPDLQSSYSCVASKAVDGSVIRVRIPQSLEQALDGSSQPMSGNVRTLSELYSPRFDVHIEDSTPLKTKPMHANQVLGIQSHNLSISRCLTFPYAMNVSPVPYILIRIQNLNSIETQQLHYTNKTLLTDVMGKVITGAPVSIVRSLMTQVTMMPQTLSELEFEFYLPDGQTKYPFHGLDHTMTLNLVIRTYKRKFEE